MLKVYKEEGVKRDKPFIIRDTTSQTQQVGYVDTEAQVRRMLFAGEQLMRYHRQAYEYPDGEFDIDTAEPDPTLSVGFDPVDADYYLRKATARIKAREALRGADSEKPDSESKTQDETKSGE